MLRPPCASLRRAARTASITWSACASTTGGDNSHAPVPLARRSGSLDPAEIESNRIHQFARGALRFCAHCLRHIAQGFKDRAIRSGFGQGFRFLGVACAEFLFADLSPHQQLSDRFERGENPFSDVADLSRQSPEVIGFYRLLRGLHPEPSNFVCLPGSDPSSAPRNPFQRHRPSHLRMDGTRSGRGLPLRQCSALSPA